MRIDSGTIGMESARSYKATSKTVTRFKIRDYQEELNQGNNALNAAIANGESSTYETESSETKEYVGEENSESTKMVQFQAWQSRLQMKTTNITVRSESDQTVADIRQATVRYIFDLLFKARRERFYGSLEKDSEISKPQWQSELETLTPIAVSGAKMLSYNREITRTEEETTTFSTVGRVVTADGREISFNVNVGMSRAFQEQYSESVDWTAFQLCDPLVINLDTDVAELSDQTFYFDIDGDGEKDEVSELGAGSGYLALDKNSDGKINDGKELFGTASGNGFADLAAYDQDGNGWIDEADTVWDMLQIWCKDENGKDVLYKLSEKGVGAICLQNAATDFTLQNATGQTKGVIRNTGVFLYENGNVGTIQHVDVAKYYAQA